MTNLNHARRGAYRAARTLGDINAVRRGRIIPRLYNRTIGRLIARTAGRLWWRP